MRASMPLIVRGGLPVLLAASRALRLWAFFRWEPTCSRTLSRTPLTPRPQA